MNLCIIDGKNKGLQKDEQILPFFVPLCDFRYLSYGHLTPLPPNKRAVFQLLQLDPNSYGYYFTTHAYNDPQSMRLDEPMYSNIVGGLGLVGAYTLDSLVHVLPEDFDYNKR